VWRGVAFLCFLFLLSDLFSSFFIFSEHFHLILTCSLFSLCHVRRFFCKWALSIRQERWPLSIRQGWIKNFQVSVFTDHYRSNEHQRLAWACTSGEKTMEKTIFTGQRACDEALQTFFKASYFTGKQSLSYSKFPALYKLLMSVNAPISVNMYQDEKACSDLITCIFEVLKKNTL
jgi:hypothetical protein